MKIFATGCALALALSMPAAQAINQEIRALFQPDPAQPSKNMFVNQTPNSGYCASYPVQCANTNMFSIKLPIRYSSNRALLPGDDISLRVPAEWRPLTITNMETQETEVVEVRITGIGSRYVLSKTVEEITGVPHPTGHDVLWTSRSGWLYPPAPCLGTGVAGYSANLYHFFWRTPVQAACTKTAAFEIPSMHYENIDIAYELKTPNPLSMSSGLYTGSIMYTLGPNGDFQMGSMMEPDDENLTLDFVLSVQHTLKVDLPPGGNKVSLEPAGGWQQWIEGGRKPERIFRDQMFHLSASSRFKVMMQCRDPQDSERCQMSGGGKTADVTTRMTLPFGITNGGNPVNRYLLRHNVWSGIFQPGQYVDRQIGMLHFALPLDSIQRLLQPGTSASLSTDITIIWDSEV